MRGWARRHLLDIAFLLTVAGLIGLGRWRMAEDVAEQVPGYGFPILEEKEEISALYAEGDLVYVGTRSGVHIYSAEDLRLVDTIEDVSMVYSAGIARTGGGELWIGHEKGLTGIGASGERWEFAFPEIPEGRVNTVAVREGSVWCGTYHGAARLERDGAGWRVAEVLREAEGLLCDSVNAILPLEDGILFGSYLDSNGGITYRADSGAVSYVTCGTGLPHPYVTSMAAYGEEILAGTGYMRDGGLAVLRREGAGYGVSAVYTSEDGIPGEKVRYLYDDSESLWITTEYDGVLLIRKRNGIPADREEYIYLTQENGLSDNEIKCIVAAGSHYWLGGKYGLTLIPKGFLGKE